MFHKFSILVYSFEADKFAFQSLIVIHMTVQHVSLYVRVFFFFISVEGTETCVGFIGMWTIQLQHTASDKRAEKKYVWRHKFGWDKNCSLNKLCVELKCACTLRTMHWLWSYDALWYFYQWQHLLYNKWINRNVCAVFIESHTITKLNWKVISMRYNKSFVCQSRVEYRTCSWLMLIHVCRQQFLEPLKNKWTKINKLLLNLLHVRTRSTSLKFNVL